MKCYVSENQIRLVGKAWEIKRYLQQLLTQVGHDIKLSEYAHSMQTPQPHRSLS
ncbi:Z-ring formation inhibitor MciZ [Paenibacillus aestuarii]|uniref:Z-ring formation inhibitor MciZ n=1 Tax=Paenibacillus aestuarii TaxID=516965 RepID=A0ABW0K3J8_9BACL|nr:Z-ring formation inhibitor MciZ [Paenibacillus aestuarii]